MYHSLQAAQKGPTDDLLLTSGWYTWNLTFLTSVSCFCQYFFKEEEILLPHLAYLTGSCQSKLFGKSAVAWISSDSVNLHFLQDLSSRNVSFILLLWAVKSSPEVQQVMSLQAEEEKTALLSIQKVFSATRNNFLYESLHFMEAGNLKRTPPTLMHQEKLAIHH